MSDSERLRALFAAASELAPPERGAFLRRECAGDDELLAELRSLLSHDGDEHPAFDEEDVRGGVLFGASCDVASPAAVPSAIGPGTRIGRYTITTVIGSGGMGTVYEAEQDAPRRRVALKMLRSDLASPELLERFRREAHVLGQLQHPGIAQIFEAGTFDSPAGPRPFFAMERIDGEPLHRYVERRALGARPSLELMAAVCDAVGHAHAKGVVHRDLKPENVLVDVQGRPKVLDFGVARLAEGDTLLSSLHTSAGELVGTLQYMSPEQVSGDSRRVDARADVYALGAILYELLSGRRPYDLSGRSLPEAARVILEEEPTTLGSHAPILRGDVEVMVAQALAKEPERRYADAGELAADLRRFLEDRPIQARRLSTFYFISRFARRHRALVAGICLALASLFTALVVSLVQTGIALEATEDAERETRYARLAAAAAAMAADTPSTARDLLERVAPQHRGWEWRYLASSLDRSMLELELGEELAAAGLAPDGESVLTLTRSGELARTPLSGSGPVPLARRLELPRIRAAAFAADGRRVATLAGEGRGRVTLWEVERGTALASWDGFEDEPALLRVEGEAVRAVGFEGESGVFVWDSLTGSRATASIAERDHPSRSAPIALRGDQLALGLRFGGVALFGIEGPRLERQRSLGAARTRARSLAFCPTDGRLAVGGADNRVRVYDVETREELTELVGHTGAVQAVAFLPGGEQLVSLAQDQTLRVWELETGRVTSTPTGPRDSRAVELRCAPDDGPILAFTQEGLVHAWDERRRERLSVLRGHESYVYPVAFALGGTQVASGSWDATVRLWDVATGSCEEIIRFPGQVEDLRGAPAGERIAVGTKGAPVSILDARSGEMLLESSTRWLSGGSLRWFADGRRCLLVGIRTAEGSGRGAQVWNVAGGRAERTLSLDVRPITACAVSPDGRRAAFGTRKGELVLWDLARDRELLRLPVHGREVSSLDFHPDGALVVSSSVDGSAALTDTERGTVVRTLEGHRGRVHAAAWSPDGERIATGAEDCIVRLYDPASSAPLLQLTGHEDYVYSVAFSPDGMLLASGSGDGTVRLWDARPLRERAGR